MSLKVQTEFKVRYAETDAMGVAHHAGYPVWFEVGRSDLMRALGLPYRDLEARGYYLMLTGLNVQYRRAARYDDALVLTTWVHASRSRTLTCRYELRRQGEGAGAAGEVTSEAAGDAASELIATGETAHIATDHQYRPSRLPDDLLALLAQATAPASAGATDPA